MINSSLTTWDGYLPERRRRLPLPTLDLGSHTIDYSVVKGYSRTYTYFRFRPDLTLEVILPRGKTVDVERLLRGKRAWVIREYDRASSTRQILTKESMMLGGEKLRLAFHEGLQERLLVDHEKGEVVVHAADRRAIRELVRRLYLKESSSYVVRRTGELAPSLGVKPKRVDVREIGKWGYCTRDGRLSFSWQLAALPDRLRDYVVLHELVHLMHFDHGSGFKRTLRLVCPDYRERERELDSYLPYSKLEPPG